MSVLNCRQRKDKSNDTMKRYRTLQEDGAQNENVQHCEFRDRVRAADRFEGRTFQGGAVCLEVNDRRLSITGPRPTLPPTGVFIGKSSHINRYF